MANPSETTFKDLQMDERYKKLERTLKMVLMKNAEKKSTDPGNSSAWPSISSINGDNLDTSCAAMSIHSSRNGSEVVSSSLNLRNIMSHKKQFDGTRKNIATSSEKQFDGTRKNIATSSENQFPTINSGIVDDSAMMPPPSTPGINFGQTKRFNSESKRSPLLNIGVNLDRSDNGFSIPTNASSVSSISKVTGSSGVKSASGFREKIDYNCKNSYEESNGNSQPGQLQERIFSKWRIVLNDRAQLIIKGTLECGKVARSKAVIRRLTPTRVQSIFKHTYHLKGNLVDERDELPDYVRGKFYNGFPDDWENVYQIWRNYVVDGSRLSFRWPTPITDSDDDIKSGITEISYRPSFDRYKKTRSPRKRARSSSILETSLVMENENRSDKNCCACSQTQSVGYAPKNLATLSDDLSHSRSKSVQETESPRIAPTPNKDQSSHETSVSSLDNSQKTASNSLKDMIQQDKLNIIIDNLTNKNCSMEYINKIVEMFECLKFVISYQSTELNDTEENDPTNLVKEKSSRTPNELSQLEEKKKNLTSVSSRSMKNCDRYENHSGTPRPDRLNNDRNKLGSPKSAKKSTEPRHDSEIRKNLTKHNYESSESEIDYYDDMRRRTRKSQRYKDYRVSNVSTKKYHDSGKTFGESKNCGKYNETSIPRTKRDLSFSEEEFGIEERTKMGKGRELPSLRERRDVEKMREKSFPIIENYDSSVSITEDDNDERYREKLGAMKMRKDNYDSNVSITEDEHVDVRMDVRRDENVKYPESRAFPLEPEVHRTENVRDDLKRLDTRKFTESHSRSVEPEIGRNVSDRKNYRKNSTFATSLPDQTLKSQENNAIIDKPPIDHEEDSVYVSSEVKRHKESNISREIMKTARTKLHETDGSNETDYQKIPETLGSPLAKNKTPQIRAKPTVMSSEIVNVNLRARNWPIPRNGNENNKNSANTIRRGVDKLELNKQDDNEENRMSPKNSVNILVERSKIVESSPRSRSKETKLNERSQVSKSTREIDSENNEKPMENLSEIGEFGSESNPKQLTAWIPAVICEDDENSKCRLIFEGKLLNEAGHVVNRKFSTDFVKRRLNPKLIETIDHVFYRLVGDFNDTKRAVPKEVVKLCQNGCPSRISNFCEKWKSVTADSNGTPSKQRMHNTSVDFLSVPTSSRGRRILPPLNYWSGERVTMKDNRAVYNPGNGQESSILTSLEHKKGEIPEKRHSPRGRSSRANETKGKRNEESTADGTKKKDVEKISPPNASKLSTTKPSQSHESQKSRNGKRRLVRKLYDSSSESDEDEEAKPTPRVLRKRKTRVNDPGLNTESTRQLRNSSRNTASSQSFEKSLSPKGDSFEKPEETAMKSKLRKRQKIDQDEVQFVVPGIPKQSTTRGQPEITCKFYQNVPLRDDDLSEDQLSTI